MIIATTTPEPPEPPEPFGGEPSFGDGSSPFNTNPFVVVLVLVLVLILVLVLVLLLFSVVL